MGCEESGVVGKLSRRGVSGRVDLPEVREGLAGYPGDPGWVASTAGGPGEVRRHSRRDERVGRPYRRASGGQEDLPEGVGRHNRMNGRDRKALPEGREASRGPPGGLGGVCRPIRRAMRSLEWSEGPPGWL